MNVLLNTDDLKGWVGTYSFADIKITGQTTQTSIKAEGYGDDEWISLVFQQYLPDHVMGGINDTSSALLFQERRIRCLYLLGRDKTYALRK